MESDMSNVLSAGEICGGVWSLSVMVSSVSTVCEGMSTVRTSLMYS